MGNLQEGQLTVDLLHLHTTPVWMFSAVALSTYNAVLTNLPWQFCCNSHSHSDCDSQLSEANPSAIEIHTFSEATPTAIHKFHDVAMCDAPLGFLKQWEISLVITNYL